MIFEGNSIIYLVFSLKRIVKKKGGGRKRKEKEREGKRQRKNITVSLLSNFISIWSEPNVNKIIKRKKNQIKHYKISTKMFNMKNNFKSLRKFSIEAT